MSARLSKGIKTSPKLTELLKSAKDAWEAMTPEEKHEMWKAQCKSWVVGEMLLEHPEMTREYVERIYDEMELVVPNDE